MVRFFVDDFVVEVINVFKNNECIEEFLEEIVILVWWLF